MKEVKLHSESTYAYYAETAKNYTDRALEYANRAADDLAGAIKSFYESLLRAQESNRDIRDKVFDLDYAIDIANIWFGRFLEVTDAPEAEAEKPTETKSEE